MTTPTPLLRARLLSLLGPCLLAFGLLASPAAAAESPHSDLLDGSSDRLLRRASIPSDRNYHGEARLLERGDALVLQTLLYSAQLRRGVQRMRKKELYHWPADAPGAEDSTRYLDDLERAKDAVLAAFEEREDRSEHRQRMLIELVLSPTASFYAFYEVETDGDPGPQSTDLVLVRKEPLVVRDASRLYLERALRLQAEAAFDGETVELPEELP